MLLSKRQEITSVGEDAEKRDTLYTVGGNVSWYSHYGKQYSTFLKKLKIEYDLAIPLLGVYSEEMK